MYMKHCIGIFTALKAVIIQIIDDFLVVRRGVSKTVQRVRMAVVVCRRDGKRRRAI